MHRTEQRNPLSTHMDQMDTESLSRLIITANYEAVKAVEAAAKYIYICRWMKQAPVAVGTYLKWWLPPVGAVAAAYLLQYNDSFLMMLLFAGLVFVSRGILELKNAEKTLLRKGKAHDEA